MSELIQYIVVNTSVKMDCGKKCSQCAHAAVSVLLKVDDKIINEWKSSGMKKIVLKINSTDEFVKKFQQVKRAGLAASLINDAGRTQIPSGSKTAFACGPINEDEGEKYFSELKLL